MSKKNTKKTQLPLGRLSVFLSAKYSYFTAFVILFIYFVYSCFWGSSSVKAFYTLVSFILVPILLRYVLSHTIYRKYASSPISPIIKPMSIDSNYMHKTSDFELDDIIASAETEYRKKDNKKDEKSSYASSSLYKSYNYSDISCLTYFLSLIAVVLPLGLWYYSAVNADSLTFFNKNTAVFVYVLLWTLFAVLFIYFRLFKLRKQLQNL